jgi:hypothetical protein
MKKKQRWKVSWHRPFKCITAPPPGLSLCYLRVTQRLEYFRSCCSETTLTGESRFHISIPLGIEPGSSWREANEWPLDQWNCVGMQWDCRHSTGLPPSSRLCRLCSQKEDLQRAWNQDRRAVWDQVGLSHCRYDSLVTVWDEACLRRGHNYQSCQGHQCSETTLTGESLFHISTPLGIEPGSLIMGSKRVDHWTSGTV